MILNKTASPYHSIFGRMERRHRSGNREHHSTANDSRDRGRRQSAAISRVNEDHQAYKKDRLVSKSERAPGKLPQETEAAQLSGNNDYVRRWLVQTHEEAYQKASDSSVARQKAPNLVGPRTHVEIGLRYPTAEMAIAVVPSRKKRKHHTSSDSSLLEALVEVPPQPLRGSDFKAENPAREPDSDHHREKRKRGVSVSGTSISSASSKPKQEIFERRARHKTREDRYETKKQTKKGSKDDEDKRLRKKKEKKGDRKKAAKKAGEDFMRKFSSKRIGQERLTIRPSHGLGLFKNGRASFPVQRRGIPDLAFSEMDFLQRSSRLMFSMEEDKASSKSREKEKRKAVRAQDEVSTFFKPSKMPLQPIPLNQGSRAPSAYTRDRLSNSGNSDLMDRNYLGRHKECFQSLYIPEKPTLDFQRSGPVSDILSAPVRRSPIAGPQSVADKLSGKATTDISWSETQISHDAKPQDLHKLDRTQASPSPESVLRSLENTGIFRETGISMAARRAAVSSHAFEQPFKYDQMRTMGASTRTTSTLQSPARVVSAGRPRSDGLTSPHLDHRPDLREGMVTSNSKDEIPQVRDWKMKRERVIIEHFDSNLGWHEKQASGGHGQGSTTTANRDIPEQSKSAPLDRHERAQMARIERPSTTVPLPRLPLAREGASNKGGLGSYLQANALVEPEPKRRTSTNGIVEANSPSDRMKQESSKQDLTQAQVNGPKPLEILSGHHDKSDQYVSGLASTRSKLNAPSRPQILDAETNGEGSLALGKTVETIQSNASYLGLPTRGFLPGQGLSNSVHQNQHSSSYQRIGREPYFIHELQRQATPYLPSHYEDHLRPIEYGELDTLARTEATEVEDFLYSNMPTEAPFSNFYTTADNYVENVSRHAYDVFDGLDEGHLDGELWNVSLSHVDMGRENYEVEELGQQNYQEGLVTEQTQRLQFFVHDYNHSEEGGAYGQYDFSRDNEEQVFWHPHRQY